MRRVDYFEKNNASSCRDIVDSSSRKMMVTWIQQVQRTLELDPETVWIGMSFFDRYLASGRGNSRHVLQSKREFQLAAITTFYTAVKICEPVVLGIDALLQICRGTYCEDEIEEMERDILYALDWRVACHTPMEFARSLLELLHVEEQLTEDLVEACQDRLDRAVADIHLSCCTPSSSLGIACLASSLSASNSLSLLEKQDIWVRLSEICKDINFDLTWQEIVAAQQRPLSHASPSDPKPDNSSKLASLSKQQPNTMISPSSPICVSQVARQEVATRGAV